MKYFVMVVTLLTLSGCFSRSTAMTTSTFDAVQTGSTVAALESQVGKPYAVHQRGHNTAEYEYIERIKMGNSLVSENHYFIVVTDGRVVGKYMKTEKAPAYDLIYQEDPYHHTYP